MHMTHYIFYRLYIYRGADKSLARPGRKLAQKHVMDARDFNNIETRAVIKFLFLRGGAKDLSAPCKSLYRLIFFLALTLQIII